MKSSLLEDNQRNQKFTYFTSMLANRAEQFALPAVHGGMRETPQVTNSCMLSRFGTHQFTLRHEQGAQRVDPQPQQLSKVSVTDFCLY